MVWIELTLKVVAFIATAAAAYYWYKASVAPVPSVGGLAGLANPPGMLGRPLGGGTPVIMSGGPINEIVEAVRHQGVLNKRGALAASIAAACGLGVLGFDIGRVLAG